MIRWHRQATRSSEEIADYILRGGRAAADRFVQSVARTLIAVETMPRVGRRVWFKSDRFAGARMCRVYGFSSYLIIYRPTDDGILILDIVHGARDLENLYGGDEAAPGEAP